jgi:hypothetical protein
VYSDDMEISAEGGKVRFVHLSPDAPAVDVAVKNGPVLFENVSFRQGSDYLLIPTGTYDLEVRVVGTGAVALEVPGFPVSAGINTTVFARGTLADSSLAAQAETDINEVFLRGDSNRDSEINLTDAIATLVQLFIEPVEAFCPDAADVDDDGHLSLADPISLLNYLYADGSRPPAPYPGPGLDLTADNLTCTTY